MQKCAAAKAATMIEWSNWILLRDCLSLLHTRIYRKWRKIASLTAVLFGPLLKGAFTDTLHDCTVERNARTNKQNSIFYIHFAYESWISRLYWVFIYHTEMAAQNCNCWRHPTNDNCDVHREAIAFRLLLCVILFHYHHPRPRIRCCSSRSARMRCTSVGSLQCIWLGFYNFPTEQSGSERGFFFYRRNQFDRLFTRWLPLWHVTMWQECRLACITLS